jgi:hypothetical membrane protein
MEPDRVTRRLLAAGAVGPPLFVAVFLVDGATRPGYDPTYHPVSALSLGDRGWLQITSFVVTGLLMLGFAVGLRRALQPGPAARWAPYLVGAYGLALVLSGVFVMDPLRGYPPGTPPGDPVGLSWHHDLHDAVGVVVFIAAPLACLGLARWFAVRPARRAWAGYCLATGIAGLALFGWFGAAWEADHELTGLLQRVTIVVGWSWFPAVALRLLADLPHVPGRERGPAGGRRMGPWTRSPST